MQKIKTRLLVIRQRFANFANTAVIVLAIFVVSLAAIETRTQDFTVDDGKFYLLDGRYLLTKAGGSVKLFSKTQLVEDSRYGKVFYVILSLQKDYKISKEN